MSINMENFLQSKEIKIPKASKNQNGCDFKSSFARSLSFSNNYIINNIGNNNSKSINADTFPIENNDEDFLKSSTKIMIDPNIMNGIGCYNKSDEDKQKQLQRQQTTINCQECKKLKEENRRLTTGFIGHSTASSPVPIMLGTAADRSTNNVENSILHSKIETLQWQLRQVENSRQMHRALMEEVIRYLEKCYSNLGTSNVANVVDRFKTLSKTATMSSALSLSNASTLKSNNMNSSMMSFSMDCGNGRTRSSTTNLIDSSCTKQQLAHEESYCEFRDYTWRRTKKSPREKSTTSKDFISVQSSMAGGCLYNNQMEINNNDVNANKLSEEAFRLYRLVQNFLNTNEPSLMMPTNHDSSEKSDVSSEDSAIGGTQKEIFMAEMIGQRRSSQSSLHSIDESSSVNSYANYTAINRNTIETEKNPPKQEIRKVGSRQSNALEDIESGFSSMNSFHEIGLPIIKSPIVTPDINDKYNQSYALPSDNKSAMAQLNKSREHLTVTQTVESIKSIDVNGTQMDSKANGNHRRWESVPAISLSTNNDNSMRVLWV